MKRKNDTFAQLVVGVFMVTILLLLGYFTIVISGVDVITGRERVKLTAVFDQVGGLKDHDNVMYRGTKVGTVERVDVTPSNLVVTAYVDRGVVLREKYRVAVCSLSMLGGNYMLLEEGAGDRLDIARTVLRGETPNDWMRDVSRITGNLRRLTENLEIGGVITNLQEASRAVRAVALRIETGGVITNLEATSASAREISRRIEKGEGLLGKLTAGGDALYEDIKATAANAREISARLNRQQLYDDLQAAVADFRKVCANVSKASEGVDLKASIARADELIGNLNAVAERVKRGEGTLGRLTTEDGMYKELEGLIRDCRQIIDNYRDTTPISTFSSLATGAL